MFMGKPFLSLLNMASGPFFFFLGRKPEVEDDLNYGMFWALGYVFSIGLKALTWPELGLGFIKIKQNNVVWAWALLKLSK